MLPTESPLVRGCLHVCVVVIAKLMNGCALPDRSHLAEVPSAQFVQFLLDHIVKSRADAFGGATVTLVRDLCVIFQLFRVSRTHSLSFMISLVRHPHPLPMQLPTPH